MSSGEAKYSPSPKHSVYTRTDRYGFLKEDHKLIIGKLKEQYAGNDHFSLVDVGCGQGELLYNIRNEFQNARLFGFDYCREFIDTALGFDGLQSVEFACDDLYNIIGEYDVVVSDGVVQIFEDYQNFLLKMVNLCVEGGKIYILGLFNPCDIDVRVQFRDYTFDEYKELWRKDFNQHSQRRISLFLRDLVTSSSFEPVRFDVDIKQRPEDPTRAWTIRDENGDRVIVNGLNVIVNKHLLSITR